MNGQGKTIGLPQVLWLWLTCPSVVIDDQGVIQVGGSLRETNGFRRRMVVLTATVASHALHIRIDGWKDDWRRKFPHIGLPSSILHFATSCDQ